MGATKCPLTDGRENRTCERPGTPPKVSWAPPHTLLCHVSYFPLMEKMQVNVTGEHQTDQCFQLRDCLLNGHFLAKEISSLMSCIIRHDSLNFAVKTGIK